MYYLSPAFSTLSTQMFMSFYFLDYSHFIHCGIILFAVIGNYQACGKASIYYCDSVHP